MSSYIRKKKTTIWSYKIWQPLINIVNDKQENVYSLLNKTKQSLDVQRI